MMVRLLVVVTGLQLGYVEVGSWVVRMVQLRAVLSVALMELCLARHLVEQMA